MADTTHGSGPGGDGGGAVGFLAPPRAAPARAKEGDDDDDAAVRRVTYDHGEDRWMLHAGVVVVLFGGAVGGSLRQRGFPRPRRKKEF